MTLGVVAEPLVTVWVDFYCPGRYPHYLATLPLGTVVQRAYCRGCKMVFRDQVVR